MFRKNNKTIYELKNGSVIIPVTDCEKSIRSERSKEFSFLADDGNIYHHNKDGTYNLINIDEEC